MRGPSVRTRRRVSIKCASACVGCGRRYRYSRSYYPAWRPKKLKPRLKWLTDQLGPARDFDVLIEGHVRPMHRPGPITAELGVLEND
jgi:hypothetical protein